MGPFYHVVIEIHINNQKFALFRPNHEDVETIKKEIIKPYIQKKKFFFDGRFVKPDDIIRFMVKETENDIELFLELHNEIQYITAGTMSSGPIAALCDYYSKANDITESLMDEVLQEIGPSDKIVTMTPQRSPDKNKVFIVHGHDSAAKHEAARFIESLRLQPVILHEQPNIGKTIIEKLEHCINDCGFSIVLYTPCDLGRSAKVSAEQESSRARQNVVFEHGYVVAHMGRDHVVALRKPEVEQPSDLLGVLYVEMDSRGAWKNTIAKEMKAVGIMVDENLIR